ncbi:MGH1-like glycoside hydrolase domain-containing protein [Niabella aurantiaca]|uniref:MGH1-like glycoside hydrolase domain-containing protein n=1 Tax=Niabella aurantiaca TaxID=379900 RepID=UPI000378BDB4|nr:glycosyl hydrolase family 65 protein [Niabella aurantiaca]
MRIKLFNGIFFLLITGYVSRAQVLQPDTFKHYVDHFNTMEQETIVQAIPNTGSWNWMQKNIPLFNCPDKNFEEIYYFRWWTLRKHIEHTPHGFAFTEFLIKRSYADKYNLISSALGHHIYESRWLHDQQYLNDDLLTWYRGNEGKPLKRLRFYSGWNSDAIYNRYLVNGDTAFIRKLFPDLLADYQAWEAEKRYPGGLFWQYDVRDAMEETISGGRREKNPRPSINGYMYGNAKAISGIAALTGNGALQQLYQAKADTLKKMLQRDLWNAKDHFFEVRKQPADTLANVMEEIGFIPWYFNMPDGQYSSAWSKLMDPAHFNAPAGITTADRSHPEFRTHGCCKCEWDGAVWPFATSQTLTAMANVLNNYRQHFISKQDYFTQLKKYTRSQYANGRPYIGEYMDEKTGRWLTADERGRYYNHSTFNDLVITGLVGLRPRADDQVEIHPLLPAGAWDWFALDNVLYHGKIITVIWDRTGKKYHKGKGLSVWADGKLVKRSKKLRRIIGTL